MCTPRPPKKKCIYNGARRILAEREDFFFNWHMLRMHFCDWLRCTDCAKDFAICARGPEKHQCKCQHELQKKKKRIVCSFREESRTGAVRLFETILTVYVSCLPLLFALQSMLLKHAICPPAVKELVVPMCSESDADGVIVWGGDREKKWWNSSNYNKYTH